MNRKDIFLDTITAASTQVVTIATVTNPKTSIAAVASLALANGFTKQFLSRREQEVRELAMDLTSEDTVREIKKIEEEQFLDDLSFSLDKIMNQRTAPKRLLMKRVFLGYLRSEHKHSYPLEKMYEVVENLTFADIEVFKKVFMASELRDKYPIPFASPEIMENHNVPHEDQQAMLILTHTEDSQEQHSIATLTNEGLLSQSMRGVGGWGAGEGTPQIYVTQFGKYFKDYLLEAD